MDVISCRATYSSSVFYQQGSANSDVISRRATYSSNSNTLTTTDLNLKIRKHILIKMFKCKIYLNPSSSYPEFSIAELIGNLKRNSKHFKFFL